MKPVDSLPHYILSSSPHTHAHTNISRIMLDVIIALLPTTFAGVWFFGLRAVYLILVCVLTCVATEAICRLLMKRNQTICDFSAVLTGLLLALNLPPTLPLWMALVGSVFAIAIAKQVFGGLGMNAFNPALAARAFMLISFTGPMTTWLEPLLPNRFSFSCDAITTATPLATMKTMYASTTYASSSSCATATMPDLMNLFIGNMPGSIGEVSAIALLLGGIYLLIRRVITFHIPLAFIATAAVYSAIAGGPTIPAQLLTGGLLIGAIFMATDYVTSPITATGKIVFGCGCGLICMLIRQFGSYPEGCSFAILIMNALSPLIDRFTQPKPFGKK